MDLKRAVPCSSAGAGLCPQEVAMHCAKCGSGNIESQLFQEDLGTSTVFKTKTRQLGHGLFYWIFLGWWIWIFKLVLWIVAFIPMAILKALRKKRTKTTTVESTVRHIQYRTVFTCKNCGNVWSAITRQ